MNTIISQRSAVDSRLYFVWFLDQFFGGTGAAFHAVVDDFGNLIAVGSVW